MSSTSSGDWIRLTASDGSERVIERIISKDPVRVASAIGDFSIEVPRDKSLDDWAATQSRIDIYRNDVHLFRGFLYDTSHRESAGTDDATTLEGEGVGKLLTEAEIADHLPSGQTEKTYQNIATADAIEDYWSLLPEWSATVYDPGSEVVSTDETVVQADSTSDLDSLFSPGDDLPIGVSNGELRVLQSCFVAEGESSGDTVSDSSYSGGQAARLNSAFSYEYRFTPEYDIPSGEWQIITRRFSNSTHPSFDVEVNGTVERSYDSGDGVSSSVEWAPITGTGSFDLSAGNDVLIRITDIGSESGIMDFDVIALVDTRYHDLSTWDNGVDSNGYLSDPPLYAPETIACADQDTALAMDSATLSVEINDTSNDQQLQLSFDGGSTWIPTDGSEANTASVTAAAGDARQVRGRVTLDATDDTRSTATPTKNYEGQTVDKWEITADLTDQSVIDELTLDGGDLENLQELHDYGDFEFVIHHRENEIAATSFKRGDSQAEREADWREIGRNTGISGEYYANAVTVEGAERADGTRPRSTRQDDQAVAEDGRVIKLGDGKITDLSITTDAGATFRALSLLEQAQERGKRRGTLTVVPTDIDPGFAYPVDFGDGVEYVHLDEVRFGDEGELRFEPRSGLGDAVAENQRGVGEAKRR
jgi:hypothetical protein